jgi:hypothetical protein
MYRAHGRFIGPWWASSGYWPILQFQKGCWMVEIGLDIATLSRSEGSLALGHEMLRCGSA